MAHTYEVCFLFLRSGQVSEFMTRIIKFGTWVLANHACPLLHKDTALVRIKNGISCRFSLHKYNSLKYSNLSMHVRGTLSLTVKAINY